MDFKPGDILQLKSGGPTMTVTSAEGTDVHCAWFLGGGNASGVTGPHYATFPAAAVQRPPSR